MCSTCESNLSQHALFIQQIEQNAKNWETFLESNSDVKVQSDDKDYKEYNPMTVNGIEEIKIEYCEDSCEAVPDTNIYDVLDPSFMKSENVHVPEEPTSKRGILNDSIDNVSNRKRRKIDRPKLANVNLSTEYDRTCKLCNVPTFSSLARLYKHQHQYHPGEKSYICDICGSKLNNKNRLVLHMKDRHAKCGKTHQCQFCAKLFYSDRFDEWFY